MVDPYFFDVCVNAAPLHHSLSVHTQAYVSAYAWDGWIVVCRCINERCLLNVHVLSMST